MNKGIDRQPLDPATPQFSNQEIVTVAVYLVGGDVHHVDTEDIAVKTNELAPGRFTWRKYAHQINIDAVRKRLWDAARPDKCGFLMGSEKQGWMLTQKGLEFARRNVNAFKDVDLSRKALSARDRNWLRLERGRIFDEPALQLAQNGQESTITRQQAESFFRLDDYVTGAARERKIERILNYFGEDPDIGQATKLIAAILRGRSSCP